MQDEPRGYQEIGASIGQSVAEGLMTLSKAAKLAGLLGYRVSDVKAWVEHYRNLHADELARLEKVRQRKTLKIKRWQRLSRALKQKPS